MTRAAVEGIGQVVATMQTRVGKETVLCSVVTRSQAAPQETFSQQGPVFIGCPSVNLRFLYQDSEPVRVVKLCVQPGRGDS